MPPKKAPRSLVSVLKEHSAETQTMEAEQAEHFLGLLKEMRERLLGRLLTSSGADNQGAMPAWQTSQVLDEVEASINALEQRARGFYDKASQEAAALATSHITDEIDRLGRTFDDKSPALHLQTAAVLADPARGLLARHFASSVKRYGLDVLRDVQREIAIGVLGGASYRDIVRSVGSGPLGDRSEATAERMVRTEIAGANGAAQQLGLRQAEKQVPGLQKMWMHIGSYPCKICMPLHGTVRPISGTWTIVQGKEKRVVSHSPAHPQCVCRTVAMKPGWRKQLQALGHLEQDPDDPKSKPTDL